MKVYQVAKHNSYNDNGIGTFYTNREAAEKHISQLNKYYYVREIEVNEDYIMKDEVWWRFFITKTDKVINVDHYNLLITKHNQIREQEKAYFVFIHALTYDEAEKKAQNYVKLLEEDDRYKICHEKIITKTTSFYPNLKCPTYDLETDSIILRQGEEIDKNKLSEKQKELLENYKIIKE